VTWTHTSRGRALDLLDPQPDDVDLEEIARALGHQCRYNGCTRQFYSVAEHCVLIARALRRDGATPDLQLAGLLHDAAEAYTGDLTWPVQAVLFAGGPDHDPGPQIRRRYKAMQARLDALICALVGLDPEWLDDERVHDADMRILLDEREVLLEGRPRPWVVDGQEPLGVTIGCLSPEVARIGWLHELERIQIARGVGRGGM
jgi:hypothetical protein